jgi:outer membrane lipoprotein-sorting protein
MIASSKIVLVVFVWLMIVASAAAQSPEADPAAMKAFEELVQSYRARPALTVKSTVKIELMQGDVKASGSEKTAEFIFGPSKSAVVKLNGYTCYLKDGKLTSVHEKTDHSSTFRSPNWRSWSARTRWTTSACSFIPRRRTSNPRK